MKSPKIAFGKQNWNNPLPCVTRISENLSHIHSNANFKFHIQLKVVLKLKAFETNLVHR